MKDKSLRLKTKGSPKGMKVETALVHTLPPRRYLTREEAAGWLGVSADTFSGLDIPFVNLGPRCKRWDVVDIEGYAEQNKSGNSARTSASQKGRQICDFLSTPIHQTGGLIGGTQVEAATVKALGLKIKN